MPRTPPDQTTVNLKDPDTQPNALPHESDQQPDSQKPAAKQNETDVARKGYTDARRGRPDTSAPPQLQQPSPDEPAAAEAPRTQA